MRGGPAHPRTHMPKRQRSSRRGTVDERTLQSVSHDAWVMVCAHLYFSPHSVFRLLATCRGIRRALACDARFWETFYRRIERYQAALSAPARARAS